MERQAPVQSSHRPTKTNVIHNARTQRVCDTEMLSVLLVAAALHTRSCRSMHSPCRNSVPCQHIRVCNIILPPMVYPTQVRAIVCWAWAHVWVAVEDSESCHHVHVAGCLRCPPTIVNSVVSGWRRSFPLTTTAHSCSRVRLRMRGQLYLCCCRWWHAVVQRGDCRRLRLAPGCGSNRLSRSPSRYAAPGCS